MNMPYLQRLVTLETLEPGDEVSCQIGATILHRRVIDIGKHTGVVVVRWIYESEEDSPDVALTVEELRSRGFKPVQPASPPAHAEKEEEWWEKEADAIVEDGGFETSDFSHRIYVERIGKLVAKAKRRGAEEAWREAKDIIRDRAFQMDCGSAEEHQMKLFSKINAKLESLNNPAGAGEK